MPGRREEDFHAPEKNLCPEGHEIYNFGKHFLGHYTYTLSFSVICLGFFKK